MLSSLMRLLLSAEPLRGYREDDPCRHPAWHFVRCAPRAFERLHSFVFYQVGPGQSCKRITKLRVNGTQAYGTEKIRDGPFTIRDKDAQPSAAGQYACRVRIYVYRTVHRPKSCIL